MKLSGYLQKTGRALMAPVATLPAAAMLIGVGYCIDPGGWGSRNALAALFVQAGAAIIGNTGALFAIGVAYGMSNDKNGAAALSGFVGFLLLTALCSPAAVAMIQQIPPERVPAAFGRIKTPFVGILVGIMAAELYNRFSQIELPRALALFSGRRLAPILTSLLTIAAAPLIMLIWPPICSGLAAFGALIPHMETPGVVAYAFFHLMLLPLGLALFALYYLALRGASVRLDRFTPGRR